MAWVIEKLTDAFAVVLIVAATTLGPAAARLLVGLIAGSLVAKWVESVTRSDHETLILNVVLAIVVAFMKSPIEYAFPSDSPPIEDSEADHVTIGAAAQQLLGLSLYVAAVSLLMMATYSVATSLEWPTLARNAAYLIPLAAIPSYLWWLDAAKVPRVR